MEVLTMKESNIKLANQLSIKDMSELIQIFADRICVFNVKHKSLDDILISKDWDPVCINGSAIQINVSG
jgi:hypothetical protein